MHTNFTLDSMDEMDADAHDSTSAYSRSAGLLSQAGNADSELKTRVSDDAADDFRRTARALGMGTAEFLRIIVLTRLYGVEGVSIMTKKHLEQVAGISPTQAPEKDHA